MGDVYIDFMLQMLYNKNVHKWM